MNNKVSVSIGGQEYTLLAAEEENYVRQCAQFVDKQMRELAKGNLSQNDAAVLAAMNVTDLYFKEREIGENLRHQVKDALEDASRLKRELAEAMRELFRLQNRK